MTMSWHDAIRQVLNEANLRKMLTGNNGVKDASIRQQIDLGLLQQTTGGPIHSLLRLRAWTSATVMNDLAQLAQAR